MIRVKAPRGARITFLAGSLFFCAAAVVTVWAALTDPDGSLGGPSVAWALAGGLFWGAWLALSLWGLGAASATYEANESGVSRTGGFSKTHIEWREIARYRVRKFGGDLTYIFYDRQGRRRTAIDFQVLDRAGEDLFRLVMRKLSEVLPGQDHARPAQAYLRRCERGVLPKEPAAGAKTLRRRAGAGLGLVALYGCVGLFFGVWGGQMLWRDMSLLYRGRSARGVVMWVQRNAQRIGYCFSAADGNTYEGEAHLNYAESHRLQVGDPIAVRYSTSGPPDHAPEAALPRGRVYPRLSASALALLAAGLAWRRRKGAPREFEGEEGTPRTH